MDRDWNGSKNETFVTADWWKILKDLDGWSWLYTESAGTGPLCWCHDCFVKPGFSSATSKFRKPSNSNSPNGNEHSPSSSTISREIWWYLFDVVIATCQLVASLGSLWFGLEKQGRFEDYVQSQINGMIMMLPWCKDSAKTNQIAKESFMKSPDLEGWRPFSLGGALVFYGVWWLWCFWSQAKRTSASSCSVFFT